MRKHYMRTTQTIQNPFHDRRNKFGFSQFSEVPEGSLIQFYYEQEKTEWDGKTVAIERLYAVNILFNGSRYSVPRFEFKKDTRKDFWEILENNSVQDEPRSSLEIHQACDEPAIDFYIDLLKKHGYSFTELLALHDVYARAHYD